MRRLPLIASLLLFASTVFSATTIVPLSKPSGPTPKEVMIPLTGTQQQISVEDYLKLTPKTYKELTGKKMSFRQRLDLTFSKKYLRRAIRKDGTVDVERMKKVGFFSGWHWHWGGFALGFFLSILGPIVALFFNDEYKWDRFWTALHTAVWVALIGVAIAAIAAGGAY